MRIWKRIPIGAIDMDRWAIRPKALVFALVMDHGGQFPPIRVAAQRNGRYRILDGRHRVTAAKLTGRKQIWAIFSTTKEKRAAKAR